MRIKEIIGTEIIGMIIGAANNYLWIKMLFKL
jgi:uncharacterized membrane protein YheB (UPF0754 family)